MRTVSRVKQTLENAARKARRIARPTDASRKNVAVRGNVRRATNVGHDGGVEYASADQAAPIIQRGNHDSPAE